MLGCQSRKGKKLSDSRSQEYLLVICALFTELYSRGWVEEKGKKEVTSSRLLRQLEMHREENAEGHKKQSKKSTANKINTIQLCVINRGH